jgi:hypothetical protein
LSFTTARAIGESLVQAHGKPVLQERPAKLKGSCKGAESPIAACAGYDPPKASRASCPRRDPLENEDPAAQGAAGS